ncbi:hypothetical protein EJB05_00138, partial [Eragrostis curvula]
MEEEDGRHDALAPAEEERGFAARVLRCGRVVGVGIFAVAAATAAARSFVPYVAEPAGAAARSLVPYAPEPWARGLVPYGPDRQSLPHLPPPPRALSSRTRPTPPRLSLPPARSAPQAIFCMVSVRVSIVLDTRAFVFLFWPHVIPLMSIDLEISTCEATSSCHTLDDPRYWEKFIPHEGTALKDFAELRLVIQPEPLEYNDLEGCPMLPGKGLKQASDPVLLAPASRNELPTVINDHWYVKPHGCTSTATPHQYGELETMLALVLVINSHLATSLRCLHNLLTTSHNKSSAAVVVPTCSNNDPRRRLAFRIRRRRFTFAGAPSLLAVNRSGVWSAGHRRYIRRTRYHLFCALRADIERATRKHAAEVRRHPGMERWPEFESEVAPLRRRVADLYLSLWPEDEKARLAARRRQWRLVWFSAPATWMAILAFVLLRVVLMGRFSDEVNLCMVLAYFAAAYLLEMAWHASARFFTDTDKYVRAFVLIL